MKNLTINVGDYVRTDKGLIGKLIKKEEYKTHCILEYEGQYCKRVLSTNENDDEVIKSSPNIIDLIEVGDYVNGEKVIALKGDPYADNVEDEDDVVYTDFDRDYGEWLGYKEIEIKSIVTKEQMEAMEYKIER